MKIAIFSDLFLPIIDGIVTSLEQLVLEFDRQGHEVFLVVPRVKGAPKKIGKNVIIYYLPSIPVIVHPTWHFSLISPRLIRTFKSFSPDVVQIATPANVGFMGIFLAKQQHLPLIGVFHTYFMKPEYLQVVGITRGMRFVENLGWRFTQMVFGQCTIIISPAESVKKDLLAHKIKKEVVVCPNGLKINTNVYIESLHEKIKKRFKITPTKTFLYLGRLSKEKNLANLIKVFYLLHRKEPDAKLLIVGDGPIRRELEQLVLLYDIHQSVVFLGEIKHEDIFRLGIFKLARAFVTCSTSEVQPMSLIEGLFFGLPIIAPRSQGMVDLVDQGRNGFLVKPGALNSFVKVMQTVLIDDLLHKNMSVAAKEKSKFFTSKHSAEKYLQVFKRVIDESATTTSV